MHKKKIIKEEVSPKLAPILCIVDFVGFVGVFLYKEIIFFWNALNCSWFAVVISCEDGSFGVCFFSSIILWLFISNSAFYIGLWLIYLLTLHFHVSIVVLSCEGNLNVSVMWEWIHLKLIFNQMYHFILILWKKNRYIYIYCNSVN